MRALASEFPYRTRVAVDGVSRWVVSWSVDGELILGSVDPGENWLCARIEHPVWIDVRKVRRGKYGRSA